MPRGISYLAFGVAFGAAVASYVAGGSASTGTDQVALFSRVVDKVNEYYVDKPDENKMVVAAINGMLASLDPHSTYLDAKALTDFQTTMKGEEFGGLGLEVMQEGGLVRVVSPIDDTPAARAGMMSGTSSPPSTMRPCRE